MGIVKARSLEVIYDTSYCISLMSQKQLSARVSHSFGDPITTERKTQVQSLPRLLKPEGESPTMPGSSPARVSRYGPSVKGPLVAE
jgi:hypothetical protein